MKKILAVVLALAVVLSMSVTAFAAETGNSRDVILEEFAAEVSIDDLKDGITFAVEDTGDGNYVVRQISDEEVLAIKNGRSTRGVEATFHCGLSYDSSTHKGYLHWNATGDQLTRVQANVFCKSTSLFSPDIYFDGAIDGYKDLSGRYNTASGATSSFSIPSNVTKVKVGWSSAYVTTVTGGKMSMASASQTVTLANLS